MRRRIKLAAAVVGLVGLGATAGFASNTFTDVPAGRFYSDAVDWAFNNGVTVGTSATTFSPEDPATRAQSVTLLHRYDQNVVQPALDDISSAITTNTGDIAGLATAITSNAGGIAGLDTLGELSCTAAQVVINDNGWRCADPVLTRSFAGVMNYDVDNGGEYTSVAIGTDGNPVISHYDGSDGGGLVIYVCGNEACTTGTSRTLDNEDWAGYFTSIAIGANGNPIISYRRAVEEMEYIFSVTAGSLELYVCGDPACTTGTKRTLGVADPAIPEGWEGYFTSIAIGDDGNPVISHGGPFSGLHLYVCDDPTCTTGTNRTLATSSLNSCGGSPIDVGEEPDYCTAGQFTSVAIGADGNPVISHGMFPDEETVDGPEILALYVCDDPACTTGTNRTLVTADYLENGVRVGGHTSIAIGVDGNPVISHTAELTDGPNLNVAIAVFAVTGIAFE
ncbi:MAG: S-layer homology domain-containing protein [Acidimicrobiales bacterium]